MLLEGKTAIIYGASGHVGGAVTRVFAREGAEVFLVEYTRRLREHAAAVVSSRGNRYATTR